MPITFSIHDPAQIATFIEAAEQTSSPSSYAAFLKREAAVRAKTGIDLNSLIKLLTGDLIISSDTKTTLGRVTVNDPAAAAATLSKLASAPSGLFKSTSRVTKVGHFYVIRQPSGSRLLIGLVGNQLVVGKGTPAQLQSFATAPASPASGAKGAVAFRIGLASLVQLALHSGSQSSQIAQTLLTSLSDFTGWASASPSGITGDATIAVK